LLYPAKDVAALVETIRYALRNRAELEAIARRGREQAVRLTEERMCVDTLDALHQLGSSRVT
jgi:hypothetical protein